MDGLNISDNTLGWNYTSFVADAGTNTLTVYATTFYNGETIRVRTLGGVLPSGLSPFTVYYVINWNGSNAGAATFKLSLTNGGSPVSLGTAGSGTNEICISPVSGGVGIYSLGDLTNSIISGNLVEGFRRGGIIPGNSSASVNNIISNNTFRNCSLDVPNGYPGIYNAGNNTIISGNYSGDGSQPGIFDYGTNSTITGNNFTNGTPNIWAQTDIISTNVQSVFNVKSYGATGNGSTDDSAAIQAAINAAAVNGGTVWFPQGTYNSSAVHNVPCNINLLGDGQTTSKIVFTAATNGIVYSWPTYAGNGGFIRDLGINSGGGLGSGIGLVGLTVLNVGGFRIDRCNFFNWSRQGVLILDCLLCEFNENFITYCGSPTYAAVEVGYQAIGTTTWYWNNSNCTQNFSAKAGLYLDSVSASRVCGGTSESSNTAIQISCLAGARGCSCITIDGLDFEGPNADGYSLIDIGYGTSSINCFDIKILNSTVYGPVPTDGYAIRFKYTDGAYVDGCVLYPYADIGNPHCALWYEGTTNINMGTGINSPSIVLQFPYVMVNGIVDDTAVSGKPWNYGQNILTGWKHFHSGDSGHVLTNAELKVLMDTYAGTLALTTPPNPLDGQRLTVKDPYGYWDTHNGTLTVNAGQRLEYPKATFIAAASSATFSTNNGCYVWEYSTDTTYWHLISVL